MEYLSYIYCSLLLLSSCTSKVFSISCNVVHLFKNCIYVKLVPSLHPFLPIIDYIFILFVIFFSLITSPLPTSSSYLCHVSQAQIHVHVHMYVHVYMYMVLFVLLVVWYLLTDTSFSKNSINS